ncbi:MAG TPA: protein-L-isoaspartate O-methyltransferase [Alphaproteobacteria bacterium]|nr:protein-L-isoaspartate O-methyltransferase [Alphaproteobacteria bacterium]
MSALPKSSGPNFEAARNNMIESQLRPNKVRDERILSAMGSLPREMFVPSSVASIAYIDEDVQIAGGRYLLEPMVLARLIEEAGVKSTDRVLDIGMASGYSTVVLASMAQEVIGVEADSVLQKQATANLASLGINNARAVLGPLAEGYAGKAPYDVIIINGGAEQIPTALFDQLAEGGRLMAVVREYGPAQAAHTGEARLYEKIHGNISHRVVFDANVKLLAEFAAPPKFKF